MSQFKRRISKIVTVGKLPIGGGLPVSVQSMTTPHTSDIVAVKHQIQELEDAGCQLIRMTVSDEAAARALPEIRKAMTVPLGRFIGKGTTGEIWSSKCRSHGGQRCPAYSDL